MPQVDSFSHEHDATSAWPENDLPYPDPLPEAVAVGLFGTSQDGYHCPGEEEVQSLTDEHAREMVALLAHRRYLESCVENGLVPSGRRRPRSVEKRELLHASLIEDIGRLAQQYQNCIEVYANGFGFAAAESLDAAVNEHVESNHSNETGDVQRKLFNS